MSETPRSVFPRSADEPDPLDARASAFEDTLDETLDSSFPASDPPSTNPAPTSVEPVSAGVRRAFRVPPYSLLWAATAGALVLGAFGLRRLLRRQAEPCDELSYER